MNWKQLIRLLTVALAVVVVAAGCGSSKSGSKSNSSSGGTSSGQSGSSGKAKVKVGLILDSPKNDGSWSQAAYVGMKKLADEGLVELEVQESVPDDPATTTRVVTGMAEAGDKLIVAHSFSYGEAMRKVAKNYPNTDFAWAGAINGVDKNVADYDQPFFQASYLEGILAGGVTKSGTIGGLAGFDIPACHSMIEAFKLGAQVVKPDTKLLSTYTGSWIDAAKNKEAAVAQADQRADVLVACGVDVGALQGAKAKNIGVMGYTQDESSQAPNNIVASMVWNMDVIFRQMVDDINNGTFQPGKFYKLGVKEGALTIAINKSYPTAIPADVMSKFDEKLNAIKSGSFEVPYVPGTK